MLSPPSSGATFLKSIPNYIKFIKFLTYKSLAQTIKPCRGGRSPALAQHNQELGDNLSNLFFLAQQQFGQPYPGEPDFFVTFLVAWGPLFLIALVMFLVLRGVVKNANAIQDRSKQHMESMQAKTDEMIQILKEIRDKQ